MRFGFCVAYFLGLVMTVTVQNPAEQTSDASAYGSQGFTAHDSTAKFVGTATCVQCHKRGHKFATHSAAGKEYAIWANQDPHSGAYRILFNEQSKNIAKNLQLETPPHKNGLCLNCHAENVPKQQLALNSKHTLADGVGCESCHGPAEQWLVPHKLTDWKYWSSSEKSGVGFFDTDNIATRARICAECHVGSAGRDVNHDLIAAGHPRLFFEMSAHQAKLPRHWSRTKDLMQNSATESRLWLVGQYVSAAAALELLDQRVNNAKAPWPEFAEYSCSSCHHNLAETNWQDAGFFNDAAGKPDWGSWHFSMLDQLSNNSGKFISGDFKLDIGLLRAEMQNPLPERDAIGSMTIPMKDYCSGMAEYLAQLPISEQDVVELSRPLIGTDNERAEMNWDVLTQQYLAAVALRQSLMDVRWMGGRISTHNFEQSKISLLQIRDTLKFIENYNGPKDLDADQRKRIDQSFGEIFDSFKN